MRYISVFSGIEAASVAFQPLGMEPVAFAEVDAHASAVLAAHYPDIPNLGDVTKVDWEEYRGKADLVVGGSPCQSFSIAGKREGLKGESGLMYEFIRCVREVRPRWFLWENVPGALSSEHGAAFGQLLHEMADGGGYGCAWRVLDAQFFGVAQRRRRLFLVGRAGNGFREACQVLFEPDCMPGNSASSRAKREELASRAGRSPRAAGFCNRVAIAANQRGEVRLDGTDGQTVGAIPATRSGKQLPGRALHVDRAGKRRNPGRQRPHAQRLARAANMRGRWQRQRRSGRDGREAPMKDAMTLLVRCGKAGGGKGALVSDGVSLTLGTANMQTIFQREEDGLEGYIVRRLTPTECERLQGFPDGWTDVPDFDGKPMSDAQRYKQLGNSMAVPVMRWIGERMLGVDDDTD